MGARVVRMFRNVNLENRAFREISKEKPQAAPRHAVNVPPETVDSDAVIQKNHPLLKHLKTVYVESTDPDPAPAAAAAAAAEASKEVMQDKEGERRPLKFSLPVDLYGLKEITHVPKGKLTLTEALKALGSHHRQPQTWTPEKISQEYSLDLKDTKAVLKFFTPFQVQIIPTKTEGPKQIKAS